MAAKPAHIVHIIFRFDIGGLENGVVNLINQMPEDEYRHSIVCLTDYNPEFFKRIIQATVKIHALDKRDGNDIGMFIRLWRLLRKIKPDLVHTRNVATLETQLVALLAGVSARVHGEHGWDMGDLSGGNRKYQILRRAIAPFVSKFIALSRQSAQYLERDVKIAATRIEQIINGVDANLFTAAPHRLKHIPDGLQTQDCVIFGTVGRLAAVKNQKLLLTAFITLMKEQPQFQHKARLVLVGDGPEKNALLAILNLSGLESSCFFIGASDEVAQWMRLIDVFVLPSLAEGISNTILEAMATGLPVIATDVGGNSELVIDGETGALVPVSDSNAMVACMKKYIDQPELIEQHGGAARTRIENSFSLEHMVARYQHVYTSLLEG
ncbi:MAG: TIGR03088 family PEP-CTERM/XrtA system glycosyltransferase [Pseudomonadales bacterium]|nr:TIGR03088 family PEP-CTERM/XrtA system glycosyltransferase [Pseudomonadales bacterium]